MSLEPVEYLARAYRRFAGVMHCFSDFRKFCSALDQAFEADPYLSGRMLVAREGEEVSGEDTADLFEMGRVVVPFPVGPEDGFLKFSGKSGGKAFGAGDLRLMGAMAEFASSLYAQAVDWKKFRDRERAYGRLFDELPLGVVCRQASGELLFGNKAAWRLLGVDPEAESPAESEAYQALVEGAGEAREVHLEWAGCLLFVVRREFATESGAPVSAYVIHEMTGGRDRLLDLLEREYFKALCKDDFVSLALFRNTEEAGAAYRLAASLSDTLHLGPGAFQAVDAFTCGCVFPKRSVRQVRELVRGEAGVDGLGKVLTGLLAVDGEKPEADRGSCLARAEKNLVALPEALRPHLLVMDPYRPIFDTLAMALEGKAEVIYCPDPAELQAELETGWYDGVIVDADALEKTEAAVRNPLRAKCRADGFKVFHSSYRQERVLKRSPELAEADAFLQKPFGSGVVAALMERHFGIEERS